MNSDETVPRYAISDKASMLMMEIGMTVSSISFDIRSIKPKIILDNKVRTIHSSLAIENNTLTLDQMTDIINGKRVQGPKRDIREVKNAYSAYEQFDDADSMDVDSLLSIHKIMMDGLVEEPGKFRSCEVGVFSGKECIYRAPESSEVPGLMSNLFAWLKEEDVHPLIKSCVFHYMFEHIHPFEDGNGRMGRYWQSLMLSEWEPVFSLLSADPCILERRRDYYDVISKCDSLGNCGLFVEFMLETIRDSLLYFVIDQESD